MRDSEYLFIARVKTTFSKNLLDFLMSELNVLLPVSHLIIIRPLKSFTPAKDNAVKALMNFSAKLYTVPEEVN